MSIPARVVRKYHVELRKMINDYGSDLETRPNRGDIPNCRHPHLFANYNVPVGCIQWDERLRIVEWCGAAEQIFGYSGEEMIGRSGVELLFPEHARPAFLT